MSISKFTRSHGSTYTCGCCGILTRETGSGERGCELCLDCFELAGMDNHCNDNGVTAEAAGYAKARDAHIANIARKGGNVDRVINLNDYLFPADYTAPTPRRSGAATKESTMSKTTATPTANNAKAAPVAAFHPEYATSVEGKPVIVRHLYRRRYAVSVAGKDAGYITSRTYENAVGRVECAGSIKALKEMLH